MLAPKDETEAMGEVESVFWEQRPARRKVWKPERDQSSMVMERGGRMSHHFALREAMPNPLYR